MLSIFDRYLISHSNLLNVGLLQISINNPFLVSLNILKCHEIPTLSNCLSKRGGRKGTNLQIRSGGMKSYFR